MKLTKQQLIDLLKSAINLKVYCQISEGVTNAMQDPERGRANIVLNKEFYKDALEEIEESLFRLEGLDK